MSSTNYTSGSTPETVAQALGAGLQANAPVTLSANDEQLTISSSTPGANTSYPFLIQTSTWDSTDFTAPSFPFSPIEGNLQGGADQSTSNPPQTVYSFSVPSNGYDAAGNLVNYTDSVMGTWSFSYDTLNRLAGASIASAAASGPAKNLLANYCWSYDAFGNRVQQDTAANAFSAGGGASPCQLPSSGTVSTVSTTVNSNNQVSSTNARGLPATPDYDPSGDVLSDGANQYLYDAEGRICAVWNSLTGSMTGYIYDADGNRVSKGTISAWSCNPTTAHFVTESDYVLDAGGQQMSEYTMQANGTMAWQHTNVWAAGRLIATYAQTTTSGTQNALLHFYLDDPLGTRRAQTDFAGNLEQTCASLPYGDGESCPPTPTEHLFTNKQRDAESGNDYFGARYYASSMGRFLSPDWSAKVEPVPYSKLDDPQTLNLYSYVGNNPLVRVDLDGHVAGGDDAVEGVVVVGLLATAAVAGVSAYYHTPQGQRNMETLVSAAQQNLSSNVSALKSKISGWFSKSSASSSSGSDEKETVEPPQLAAGKQAHKDEEVRSGEQPEVPLPDGSGRMDRYNKGTGHIREIKPDNPRGIRAGNRQLERYKKAMEKATDRPHTTELTTYKPKSQ